jgi:hypothetical protein
MDAVLAIAAQHGIEMLGPVPVDAEASAKSASISTY